ncbi:MAG: glycosyltransferase family 2 protein, partial [candidate division WOR-3 bacterium]
MSVVWVFVGIFMGLPFLMELFLSFLSLRWKPTFPAFRSSKRVKRLPFVSVLVPAYREPPDIVIRTLESLRKQSYPNYEVLVLVNNTPEVELWLPVKLYCSKVGKPFKFVYLENVKGYKAGVLNIAENYMDPRTEIIAVVDSDYVVKSDFISSAISYFLDPDVGVVQFPQDYRDFPNNPFFVAMYYSYRYFFAVIMKICDFLRATSFMGTVGFIRKSALIDAGRWDGKVLTEDSETGLRINAYGYKCIYLDKSVGKGLMPLDMVSLKTQRFRWAFGNMQTIVKHIGLLTLYRTLPFTKKVAFIVQNTVWHNPLVMVLIHSFVSYFYRPIAISALTLTLLYFVSKSIIFL